MHRGVPCLLPAAQVVSIDPTQELGREVRLWPGIEASKVAPRRATDEAVMRIVAIRTPGGVARIEGTRLRLRAFHTDHAHPLPELLSDVLRLPHVVGLSDEDDQLRWLVDLDRFDLSPGA